MYKAAAQLRQEVKQKAKRSIEKAFLTFSLPQNQGSSSVGSVSRAAEFRQVKEARIKFVRENNLFHHGNVQMPDPSTDPSVCGRILSARLCSLTVASSGWQIHDGSSTGNHCRCRGPPVVDGAQPRGPAQGERGAIRHQQCASVEQHDCSHLQCGEQFKFRIVYIQVPSHSKSRLWWPLMRQPRAMPPSTSMRRHMPHCRIAMSCCCCGLGAYDI